MAFVVPFIPYIAAAIGAGAAVASAGQQRRVANAQRRGYEADARLQQQNADIASREAAQNEMAVRRRQRLVFGESRAAAAEQGLLGSASFEAAYRQSAADAEFDALNTRYEGQMRRRGFLAAANEAGYGAGIARTNVPGRGATALTAASAGASGYSQAGGRFGIR